jgi:hypothetical protein
MSWEMRHYRRVRGVPGAGTDGRGAQARGELPANGSRCRRRSECSRAVLHQARANWPYSSTTSSSAIVAGSLTTSNAVIRSSRTATVKTARGVPPGAHAKPISPFDQGRLGGSGPSDEGARDRISADRERAQYGRMGRSRRVAQPLGVGDRRGVGAELDGGIEQFDQIGELTVAGRGEERVDDESSARGPLRSGGAGIRAGDLAARTAGPGCPRWTGRVRSCPPACPRPPRRVC